MALSVRKQNKENSLALVRKFTGKVRKSGLVIWTRKKNYHQRPKSDQMQKEGALRRVESTKKYEKMIKMGEFSKMKKKRRRR